MKNIFTIMILCLWVSVLTAQPKIPSGKTKIRQTDRIGVLYINAHTNKKDGNVQMVNQFTDDTTALWQFILVSPGTGIYYIQNVSTGEYLGVNKSSQVPMASDNNNPPGYLPMYFAYTANTNNSDMFKWKVKFYRQRKPGMTTSVVDKGKANPNDTYESKYASDDEYDIINVETKSRLSTINVNGLMRGDEISRACLDTDDRDEFGGTISRDANGGAIIGNSDRYVARNNQSRWQLIGLPKANKVTTEKGDIQPKPVAPANNNTQISGQQTAINTNNKAIELLNKTYILQNIEIYSVKNNKRKKLPSILNLLTKNKIEINFSSDNEAIVKNTGSNQTSLYNWEIKDSKTLHLIPQNPSSDNVAYVGEVIFENSRMIHIVKEGKTETEYVYEKK